MAFIYVYLKCILKMPAPEETESHLLHFLLFSIVRFQMGPQIVCSRGGIVTLVAFVRLFSTVCYQMSPQTACMRRDKFTLVAFV